MSNFFDVEKIISEEKIETVFQPIINIEKGYVFAEEALSRGLTIDGCIIEPETLFKAAVEADLIYELDILCCKKAVEIFAKTCSNTKSILFINVNAQTATEDSFYDALLNILDKNKVQPREVGIEFLETRVLSMALLTEAVNKYREQGFVIAVDDFGSKESNIDRLLNVHPDIIKIDRSLIQNIHDDLYKKSIVTALNVYANMTGAVCLAEGIETAEEIQCCCDIGLVLFQGFGISRPLSDFKFFEDQAKDKTYEILSKVERYKLEASTKKRSIGSNMELMSNFLINSLVYDDLDRMKNSLEDFIELYPEIESLSVVDFAGKQVTKKILKAQFINSNRHPLFSLKEDCLNIIENRYITRFIASEKNYLLSDAYISIVSRLPVRTFTVNLKNIPNRKYILCICFYESGLKSE